MINDVILGIVQALYNEFGEDFKIYINNINQDIELPCFKIELINTIRQPKLDTSFIQNIYYDINYIAENGNDIIQLNDISERLFNCLEQIKMRDIYVRGENMSTTIVDEILHFQVSYNPYVYKVKEKDVLMLSLEQKRGVKK